MDDVKIRARVASLNTVAFDFLLSWVFKYELSDEDPECPSLRSKHWMKFVSLFWNKVWKSEVFRFQIPLRKAHLALVSHSQNSMRHGLMSTCTSQQIHTTMKMPAGVFNANAMYWQGLHIKQMNARPLHSTPAAINIYEPGTLTRMIPYILWARAARWHPVTHAIAYIEEVEMGMKDRSSDNNFSNCWSLNWSNFDKKMLLSWVQEHCIKLRQHLYPARARRR